MKLLHRLHLAASRPAHTRFVRALGQPEKTQKILLARTLAALAVTPRWQHLAGMTWDEFVSRTPPTDWPDVEEDLVAQRADGVVRAAPPARRWQPTSGSTARQKWIPYPPQLLDAFDEAAGAWLVDLAGRFPRAFHGRHYWSLSWLPDDLRRGGADSDDLELLNPVARWTLGRLMAVPPQVSRLSTSRSALLATATSLSAAPDLSLLSVWSPTFALSILRVLADQRLQIADWLDTGRWPFAMVCPRSRRAASVLRDCGGFLTPEIVSELWPRLALVSAWDTGASASYGRRLRNAVGDVAFQGKGLWATEAVVTIPFEGRWPVAVTAHVIELRCLATGRVLPVWQVEPGQQVQPLITTAGGLVRYALPDRLEVEGRLHNTPSLVFRGRLGGEDLVGEKLDRDAAREIVEELRRATGIGSATMWAVTEPAHYALIAETDAPAGRLAAQLDEALGRNHHYRLARELDQLGPAAVHVVADMLAVEVELARRAARPEGQWKSEVLARWPLPETPAAFLSRSGFR